MKTNNRIVLSIANILIEVRFAESELVWERDLLKNALLSFYSGFIIKKTSNQADSIVTVYDERHTTLLTKKNRTFLSFYTKQKNNYSTYYHVSLSQFNLIILSILQEHLKGFGFILHASASCVNGKAYIFCGPSGVGKSTIAKLLCPEFKQLADDSVIIRRENKEYFLYQTPLMEKNSTLFSRASTQYKIAKLCFLRQSIHTRLNHIVNKDQATHQLLNQLWINERTKQQMSLIFTFLKNNNFFYEFEFQKKKGALMKSISTIEDHNP